MRSIIAYKLFAAVIIMEFTSYFFFYHSGKARGQYQFFTGNQLYRFASAYYVYYSCFNYTFRVSIFAFFTLKEVPTTITCTVFTGMINGFLLSYASGSSFKRVKA